MVNEDDLGPRLGGRLAYRLKRAFLELDALHERHLAPSGVTARELAKVTGLVFDPFTSSPLDTFTIGFGR